MSSRRSFLKSSGAVVAVSALPVDRFAFGASNSDTLKLALIGCGGRGSGAASQALNTSNLGPVKLVAAGDIHEDRMESALKNLQKTHGESADVPKDRQFLGFDAYKKAIAEADVVILSTPPGFRPVHFEEAVRQGKHIFMEKPVASDADGVRRVLAAAVEAKKKNLKIGVGLQRHHQKGYIETVQRLHDGAIGDITSARCYWNGQRPWQKKRADLEVQLGKKLTELEYQLRNWYYFTWICGDHITEQHIHNIDVINWVKKGPPVKARAMGGREINLGGSDDGEAFDHFACEFEYADGSICYSYCRHQPGCWNSVSEHVQGTKGRSDINRYIITGDNQWRYNEQGGPRDAYQQEHTDLFTAIREGKAYSEIEHGASSTMTAILGRMAAYSGKELEYDAALKSEIGVFPKAFYEGKADAWQTIEPPTKPGPDGLYPRAIPGKTKVV
ncbi:MAG: Gfo/Idh/MocA family oxidoreductase [Chthoniobacteraceae bacterium]